jgi:predicted RNase H-like HicB family nuclease
MRRTYLGAICGEPKNFGIVFLDVPGCTSAGETIEETLAHGAEALAGHLAVLVERDGYLPVATVHDLDAVVEWLADDDGPIDETWVGLFPVSVVVPAADETVAVRIKSDLVRRIAAAADETAATLDSRIFIERAVEDALNKFRKAA